MYRLVNPNDNNVQQIAQSVVESINKLVQKWLGNQAKQCATLTLKKVINAGVETPNEIVQKFSNNKRGEVCNSCGIVLDKNIDTNTVNKDVSNYIYGVTE